MYMCIYIYIYICIYIYIHIHAGIDKHDDTRCHEGSPHGGVPWQGTLCHPGALSCAPPTYMQLRPSTGCRNITRTAPASALSQKRCFSRAKAFATKHTMTPTYPAVNLSDYHYEGLPLEKNQMGVRFIIRCSPRSMQQRRPELVPEQIWLHQQQ